MTQQSQCLQMSLSDFKIEILPFLVGEDDAGATDQSTPMKRAKGILTSLALDHMQRVCGVRDFAQMGHKLVG